MDTSSPGIRCVAGILVGGQSRRMGRAKATLPLAAGHTLVEHVVNTALNCGRCIDEVLILGQCPDMPASLAKLHVLADAQAAAGPLMGLRSLFEYAKDRWSLLLACDMPLLSPVLIERLLAAARPDIDAVAFRGADKAWHACCALYHPRLLPAAIEELRNGRRSLQNVLATARVVSLNVNPEEERLLTNLNTPGDYDRLLNRD